MKLLILSIFSVAFFSAQTKQASRTEAEAQQMADSLYMKLMNGADFKTLADTYSEDPGTKGKGGVYQNFKEGTFTPEFESVVLNLKRDEISKPFKTPNGYHIAQLIGSQGGLYSVRHILIKFN